ncbi:MAG: hypothetical protein AAF805_14520, partial [Planctomycetota bacterium]
LATPPADPQWLAYEVVGAAVPDLLGVAEKRTKCRTRHAQPHLGAADPRLAALARGVVRHHADDAWFHEAPAFGRLSLAFAKRVRVELAEQTSMRPWFLGHVAVELLLDDELARRTPGMLDRYYERFASVDAAWVAGAVETMAGRGVGRLAEFIERFAEVRFLADYADDERLAYRLSQVMQRVGLDALPTAFVSLLPTMREDVAASVGELSRPLEQMRANWETAAASAA